VSSGVGAASSDSRIVLVRHGLSSHVLAERWIDAAGVHRWRDDYDAAGIDANSLPPRTLMDEAARAGVIVASDLARAIESAGRLAPGRDVRLSPLLRESHLDIPTWLPARWPLTVWAMAIHVQWLGRLIKRVPLAPVEQQRVKDAADWVEGLARENGATVVVTHGVFRRLLGLELLARGWGAEPRVSGYQNWSAWPYVR
jgi:broad specificity phosphatase PhoE